MKSDLFLWCHWGLQHLTRSGENSVEFGVVALLHIGDFSAQLLMSGEHGAKLEEGTHDGDVHLHGAITAKNTGKHGNPVLREGERKVATASATLFL